MGISSPNAGQGYLNGITALSVDNIWAVGGDGNLSLTEHWDGTSWRVIPSPNVGTNSNAFIGVAAISANNVWAVGQSVWSQWPLIEHWDGTSWSINASPSVGTDSNALMAITSVPRTKQLWAVGWYGTGNTTTTLIEHWDGTNWSVVPGPVIGTDSILEGVTALSKNNVWAVGAQNIVGASVGQPLIEHWDGRSWSVSSRPNQESNGFLRAVARVPGASKLWAVGTYSNTNTSYETLTEYWDGGNWSIVSSPNHSPESSTSVNMLVGVTALSATNVWAVGLYEYSNAMTATQPLVEHWDGGRWNIVSSPNPGANSSLTGVTRVLESNRIWIVGEISYYQSFIESYVRCSSCRYRTASRALSGTTAIYG